MVKMVTQHDAEMLIRNYMWSKKVQMCTLKKFFSEWIEGNIQIAGGLEIYQGTKNQ